MVLSLTREPSALYKRQCTQEGVFNFAQLERCLTGVCRRQGGGREDMRRKEEGDQESKNPNLTLTKMYTIFRRAFVATTATFTASLSGLAAVAAPPPSGEGAPGEVSTYKYTPPLRVSETLRVAAVQASKPRTRVPTKPKPRVLFVLGGPGAGKGTQCSLLAAEYGFVHLSAGDLLREERMRGGPQAELIETTIREGKIVPVEITVRLIKAAMDASKASKFLVDGFPRNFDNLEGWERVVGESAVVDGVLQYEVPEDTMVARLLERGKSSGRSDDNEESIRKRLQTYASSTLPVVQHYSALGKVTVIPGDRPVEEVFSDTKEAVEGVVKAEVLATNQLLLDAIAAGDWEAYAKLADSSMTCFEPEATNLGLVRGLKFHQGVFEEAAKGRAHTTLQGKPVEWFESSMTYPSVKLLGPKYALVAYVRCVSSPQGDVLLQTAETRLWRLEMAGGWKLVHSHRSRQEVL